MDKERTLKLKKTIKGTVRKGDVVVDIGTGSGILACFAIEAKAKFVYAIEMDPSNYRAASIVIQNNGMEDVIELIHADALEVKLPKKVDVVMCELMSTALLDEPQIRLMNHAIKFLKKNGKIIPRRAVTFIEYVTTKYDFYGLKLRIPQYEWEWIPSLSRELSEKKVLFETDFSKMNEENIHCSGKLKITRNGIMNGIRLSTKTYLTDNVVHESSMGFCPRVVIPTKDEMPVNAGQCIRFDLAFKAGYGYSEIQLDISKPPQKA